MNMYDEKLRQLAAQVSEVQRLERQLTELSRQRDSLIMQVEELDKKRIKEQRDVDRFEGGSLASFFYNVIGRMDEKLTQERQEAYEAAVKYDAALRQLQSVEYDISAAQEALRPLTGSQARYAAALAEKAAAIKAAGSAAAQEILAAEGCIAQNDSRLREIKEAFSAGSRALDQIREVISSLESADGWGTFDVMGGGLLADMIKHSHLDEAQAGIEQLQVLLRRFRTELADVAIHANVQVNIDGFMRFADYFFDGFFADISVLDRIERAMADVQATEVQIVQTLQRLETMRDKAEAECEAARNALDELILRARL